MLAISNRIGIDIDSQQVLRDIGYDTDREPPSRVVSLVNNYLEHATYLINPSYSYAIKDIYLVQNSSVTIEGLITFRSEVIAQLLKHCDEMAVFVATIGSRLEDMVHHLVENRLVLQARVLDAIGSRATKKVVHFVQDIIAEEASAQGLCTSRRFSPGYCDWEISQQELLFRSMNGDSAGIRLNNSYLMIPRKSISGIVGIGPCYSTAENYNPCKICVKQDCPGRR